MRSASSSRGVWISPAVGLVGILLGATLPCHGAAETGGGQPGDGSDLRAVIKTIGTSYVGRGGNEPERDDPGSSGDRSGFPRHLRALRVFRGGRWSRGGFPAARRSARARPAPEGDGPPRPEIRVLGDTHETTDGTLPLQAAVSDRVEVLDSWVHVSSKAAGIDRKKVAYVARAQAEPLDRMEIAASVPLSAGLNRIVVCARGKAAQRCETVFVFRRPPSSP